MNRKMSEQQARELFEKIVNQLKEKGVNIAGSAFVKMDENGKIQSVEGFGSMKEESTERSKAPSKEDYLALRDKLRENLKVLLGELAKKVNGENAKVPQDILERYGYKQAQGEQMPQGASMEAEEDGENCTCPSCLNYDNFEDKLSKVKGEFDYAEVTLGKKQFKIKYHVSEHGEENMVMRDTTEDVDIENSSVEELHLLLQEAVRERKFDKAQVILNAIQQRKNKN